MKVMYRSGNTKKQEWDRDSGGKRGGGGPYRTCEHSGEGEERSIVELLKKKILNENKRKNKKKTHKKR